MTKIHLLSDLHLEMQSYESTDYIRQNADIIVLAGDIHKDVQGFKWARHNFPDSEILYVSGNHEFYHYEYHQLLDKFRKHAQLLDIHFLENNELILNGIHFLGCTLWTNNQCFSG